MGGGFYLNDGISRATTLGFSTTTSKPTTVTNSGTPNTKGAYVQLTASSAADTSGICVIASNRDLTAGAMLVDVAVGAAASEKIIIPDIPCTGTSVTVQAIATPIFPVTIPAGSRISVRTQSTTASDASLAAVMLVDNSRMGRSGGSMDSYGVISATTLTTSIDSGAVLNTKGSYTQITASTTNDLCGFAFCISGLNTTSNVGAHFLVDVAIGGAGAETVIVGNWWFYHGGTHLPPWAPWFDMDIPAGTRIAVRAQSTTTTAADRTFGFSLHGLRT